VKTSKLEDQYTNLFKLAVWLEEPLEVHFLFKIAGFSEHCCPAISKKMCVCIYIYNLTRNGSRMDRFGQT